MPPGTGVLVLAVQGPHLTHTHRRKGNKVTDESRADPARCFHLTIHLATSRATRCRAPVQWQGVIRTTDGEAHRVASCAVHVDHLEGHRPLPTCLNTLDQAAERVVVFSEHN